MSSKSSNPVRLADLVEDTIGGLWGDAPGSAEPDNIDVLVIRGADFRDWASRRAANAARRVIPRRSFARRELRLGDLVLEVSGGGPSQPVGRVVVIDGETLAKATHPLIPSNFCRRIRLKPGANPYFVKRQLDLLYRSGNCDQYQTSSTNIRNLQVDAFLDGTIVELPAPDEQDRLTKFADDVDSRTASVQSRLSLALNYMQRFRQSVLDAAYSGRLTEDWRATNPEASARVLNVGLRNSASLVTENYREAKVVEESMTDLDPGDLPESWAIAPLHLLIERGRPITYGILKPGPDIPNGIPYLRVTDFKSGTVIAKNIRRTTTEIAQQYRRSILCEGDLIFAIRGTFGQVATVPADLAGANITQDTARLSVDARLSAEFVSLVLKAPPVQRRIAEAAKGVAVRGINLGDLRELLLPLPPRPEQDEIVRRVARLLAHAESIVGSIDSVHRATDVSARSILAKAIAGDIQMSRGSGTGS